MPGLPLRRMALICAAFVLSLSRLPPRAAAQSGSQFLYLPLVAANAGGMYGACSLTVQEQQIAERMRADPEQRRPSLTCHVILAQVARARAQDMADREYFDHVNPDGFGPNYLVRQAGYVLPTWYGNEPDDNNIESIAGGTSTVEATWNLWMGSPGHRTHLLGLNSFWAEQIEYGIGYVFKADSPFGYYWVVITAKQEP